MQFDDTISLNNITALHPLVDVQVFIPFVHYRLQTLSVENAVVLSVSFKNLPITKQRRLRITWDDTTPKLRYPPVQGSVMTEWAACGIACAVLPLYTNLTFARVTERGERFDYWLSDGDALYGLEISGMMRGSLTARRRVKRKQLQSNPDKVTGYVCVVHFEKAAVHLSFHGAKR